MDMAVVFLHDNDCVDLPFWYAGKASEFFEIGAV